MEIVAFFVCVCLFIYAIFFFKFFYYFWNHKLLEFEDYNAGGGMF